MTLLQYLDFAGVAVFAATGALAASRRQFDIVGFLFFAVITGTGGGTLRVWSLETGQAVAVLEGHMEGVRGALALGVTVALA